MACLGDCCVAFPLSRTLDDLRDPARDFGDDAPKLLAMLVPLTHHEAVERRARFGVDKPALSEDRAYYRCIHWDETTRLCGNYEDRPGMCSRYPYGNGCDHGCNCRGEASNPLLWEGDQA